MNGQASSPVRFRDRSGTGCSGFLACNEQALADNHRMSRQLGGMRRQSDLADVRARAAQVVDALDTGRL